MKWFIAAILAAVCIICGWQYEYGTEHNVTFTVAHVDDQASSNSHTYLIFTTDGTVYENTDSWLHGKTDSSNVYAWFLNHMGQKVTCPVYGARIFITSSYKDILDGCTVVPSQKPDTVPLNPKAHA